MQVTPKLSSSQRTQTPGRDHASHAPMKNSSTVIHSNPFNTVKAKYEYFTKLQGVYRYRLIFTIWIPHLNQFDVSGPQLYWNLDANNNEAFFEKASALQICSNMPLFQNNYPARPRRIIIPTISASKVLVRPLNIDNYIPLGCVSSSSTTTLPTDRWCPTSQHGFGNSNVFGASSAHLKKNAGCCSRPRVVGGRPLMHSSTCLCSDEMQKLTYSCCQFTTGWLHDVRYISICHIPWMSCHEPGNGTTESPTSSCLSNSCKTRTGKAAWCHRAACHGGKRASWCRVGCLNVLVEPVAWWHYIHRATPVSSTIYIYI